MKGKMKRILACFLTLLLMGTGVDMTVFATGTVSGGDAVSKDVTGDETILGSAANADEGPQEATVSGGDVSFTEVSTEAELRTAIENGENVKVKAGITLTDTVDISKPLIVDLNGQEITGSVIAFYVGTEGIVFRDSSTAQTGCIKGVFRSIHVYSGEGCTIESGSYSGMPAISNDGTVVISGGSFYSDYFGTTIQNNGALTIYDGKFYAGSDAILMAYVDSQTTIAGGEFLPALDTNDEPQYGDICYIGGTLVLSGTNVSALSVYNDSGNNVFVGGLGDTNAVIQMPTATHRFVDGDGGIVTTLTNGSAYSYEKIPAQAMWGNSATDSNMSEGDLSEALLAAASDNNIKYIRLTDSLAGVQYDITGGVFSLDLNGKTVSGVDEKSVFSVSGSGTVVTFTDTTSDEMGKVSAQGDSGDSVAILVKDGASVIIEKGTYAGGYAPLIVEENGSATVNGGIFHGADSYYAVWNRGQLSINGGTFEAFTSSAYAIRAHSGVLTITDGKFVETDSEIDCWVTLYEGGTLDLSGVTKDGYRFLFLNAPGENQVRIPVGYAWINSNAIDNEIDANDGLTLAKPITLSFDANGGSGTMASVSCMAGQYWLPDCKFAAPENLGFLGWATTADGEVVGRIYNVTEDVTLYAVWGKVYEIYVGGVGMEDGDYLASDAEQVTKTQPTTGGYAYYKDGVLTLNNYEYNGDGRIYDGTTSAIYVTAGELEIVLQGVNKLAGTAEEAITLCGSNLTVSGEDSLEILSDYSGIGGAFPYDTEEGTAVYSTITIESGSISMNTYEEAIMIVGDVVVNGGTLEIDSDENGLEVIGAVKINGGIVRIDASDIAIYAAEGIILKQDKAEILLPQNGSISENGCFVLDKDGDPVSDVVITPIIAHNWSADYNYNQHAHWHSCTDADCFLEENTSWYEYVDAAAYGEHDTNGENGVCSVCGYDANKEVGIYVGGVGLADGEYLNNNGKISTTQPTTGGYAYYKDGVLTLNDYVYSGAGDTLYSELETLEIVLLGENQLINTEEYGDGIAFWGETLTVSGTGSLNIVAYYGIDTYGEYDDDGVLVKGSDISLESGTITIDADIDGIYCDGNVTIEDGNIIINAYDDGIYLHGEFVMNGGTLSINTDDDDGIDVEEVASVLINGGTLSVHADDNGIDGMGDFIVNGGTVNITSDTDDTVDVSGGVIICGGVITLEADDDGFRADEDILIKGGIITANTGDYGIFTYSNLTIIGGEITLTSDLDTEKTEAPAIMFGGDLNLGEDVELQKPVNGDVDIWEEEIEEDVYEYFNVIVDADGKTATYVVIKEKQTVAPDNTATPAPDNTATPAPGSTATPAPDGTATPAPGGTSTPAPGSTATPAPGGTSAPAPGSTPTAKPEEKPMTSSPAQASGNEGRPFIQGENGKKGWDVILNELTETSDGETIMVNMNGTTTVPENVLKDMAGRDITMTYLLGNGVSWTVYGKTIDPNRKGELNLAVNYSTAEAPLNNIPVQVLNKVTGEKYYVNVSLVYDGELGLTAILNIYLGEKNEGLYANLFYYNERYNMMQYVGADQIRANGTAHLAFTHASEYTIVIDKEVMDNMHASPKTGEMPVMLLWIPCIMAVAVAGGTITHKRKENK